MAAKRNPKPRAGAASGPMLTLLPTHIQGLDDMLDGGVPRGRTVVVSGSSGTGKTVLLNEFLYRGMEAGGTAVFVTFEERPDDIARNVGSFGWDYARLQREGKLVFVDASPDTDIQTAELGPDYDLSALLARILHAVERVGAERVVLDAMASLFQRMGNTGAVRALYYQVFDQLKRNGVTAMVSVERSAADNAMGPVGIEEFVADGAIHLGMAMGQQQIVRQLTVIKLRGMGYRSGTVEFNIASDGMRVFPRPRLATDYALTSFDLRQSIGVPALDKLMHGGIPQGHSLLVNGNTGTGKTTLALQYTRQGLQQGETVVYVCLEEPPQQIIKSAKAHGWGLADAWKRGRLRFVKASLIDMRPDELLYDIMDAVKQGDARRLVLDSVSSIQSASMNTEQVRQFLIQLTAYTKSIGCTTMLTYLMPTMLTGGIGRRMGDAMGSAMRLDSIVDGVLILRFTEREQQVEKLLNVLKMRGTDHDKAIYHYKVTRRGLSLGERLTE